MKTTYLTSLTTTLSPFSPHSKTARLILSLLPPNARSHIAIKTQLLPRSAAHTTPATLEMGFKDGKTMKWVWMPRGKRRGLDEQGREAGEGRKKLEEATMQDVVEEVGRHWRGLARKEELAG